PLARRRRFPLTWWAPTGGSSPKGKARGECVRILLGRYQNANQTIACQSKAFSGNKTENKTALEVDLEGDMRIDYASGGSLQTLATGSDFLLGISSRDGHVSGLPAGCFQVPSQGEDRVRSLPRHQAVQREALGPETQPLPSG